MKPSVTTRLSPTIYETLVAAASANGRSISAEVEKRIEQSLEADEDQKKRREAVASMVAEAQSLKLP
ncbi:hypothetical protein ABIF63_003556 [Bradyrhizobium japonicum]|uniref:Relaxosome protein TraY n=1 Tax=Bradyrhizobium japonicum TaxID=375 RepID=A0ABV2RRB3_BRAJP|nr:TraY domain-containing protein [Bradyrhizobium japonicum]UQD97204.1 TraY domain-containing protein [Bradyrhizobium japonicum]WLB17315.1 TraY domain-containing protein [Bradyrhizobium japonicum]